MSIQPQQCQSLALLLPKVGVAAVPLWTSVPRDDTAQRSTAEIHCRRARDPPDRTQSLVLLCCSPSVAPVVQLNEYTVYTQVEAIFVCVPMEVVGSRAPSKAWMPAQTPNSAPTTPHASIPSRLSPHSRPAPLLSSHSPSTIGAVDTEVNALDGADSAGVLLPGPVPRSLVHPSGASPAAVVTFSTLLCGKSTHKHTQQSRRHSLKIQNPPPSCPSCAQRGCLS